MLMEPSNARNPIPTPPKKKNINLEMILQLQELARELTRMLIQNEHRVIALTETIEEINMELRYINEQIQLQSTRLGFSPPLSFGGENPFG